MQVLAFINCFSANWLPNTMCLAILFLFNPIKLVLLIFWVYLCLHVIQRLQFSPLVPQNRKSLANIAGLFLGPVVLLALFIVDVRHRASESDVGILETIKQRLRNVALRIPRKDSEIRLLDASGRNIKEMYGDSKHHDSLTSHILDFTEQIILDALEQGASDILIDPKDESIYTVRLRVDGVLRTVEQIESDTCQAIINSIKAVSSMDIAERRRPQDGSFTAKTAKGAFSFRAASAGVLNGEKLSIRVLNQNAGIFTLDNIGLSKKQAATILSAINKPSGMILMCGPTGSGKTTTLYAMLNEIDLFTRNVITVEDPIEYVLPYASQIEINPKADITFAKSLRSILRQDPDVICVGEIRDEETAAIALRASQTGHLVMATIHCNTNASAMIRLLDLGVSPLLMATGLSFVISQRLLRCLCTDCKIPAQLSQSQVREFRRKRINYRSIYQAQGCEQCNWTGYLGRTAIFDILVFTNELKASLVDDKLFMAEMRRNGEQKGRSNLHYQGLRKVVSGITSVEELKRVVG